ncbi:heavy metal translocating P-type ATPase [uncultured Castellaniella sp.]|uniref:heavy metal translocating P-type ATPase n=1 Tax=uncultured Castellaniella sp. TaxID=647907 RepID=UPI0026248DF0|nr:heavy metal translocating P-type ATPase [uncultured Castellaniella sp.]
MPHTPHSDTPPPRPQAAPGHVHEHEHGHGHAHGHDGQPHAHPAAPGTGADACCNGASGPAPALAALAPSTAEGADLRTQLRILQMDCPTEEALIRQALGRRPDVRHLEFNLMQRVLTVVHAPDALDAILQTIRALGFTPEQAADSAAPVKDAPAPWWPLAAAGAAALAAEAAHWMDAPWPVPAALAILAVLGCGLGTYRKGWTAIRHGQMNINALMSIAVTGALFLGQWAEAAMVMVLYELAERIEALSLDRARNAIQGLMQLTPDQASVLQPDGSWRDVAAASVPVGARVRARPGERIALDGRILSGRSAIDQSPITGESLPIDKAPGDPVYAGTINGSGALEYQVLSAAGESTLARIIRAIESAQSARAPTQRFVDRFARVYTPLVVLLALAIAVTPPLLGLGGWHEWIYKALVLLVIACPCALVISTPVSIVSGLAAAARHGVLIKGGVHLEQGRLLRWIALDKTGTLTHGRPVLTDSQTLGDQDAARVHALAAGLAGHSDHPVSRAVAQGLAASPDGAPGLAPAGEAQAITDFEALPGRGTQGRVDQVRYQLGNHRLIHEQGLCSPALETRLEALERQGKTVVMLADAGQVLSLYAVADTVKPDSAAAIRALHDQGVSTAMLSGDNPHTAAAIAAQVGIDRAEGNLLPEDKLQAVARLTDGGAAVGMVGDGINDAPALARADIGFAMGAMGTDAAIETADVALMDDDLRKIPWFIGLSRATHRILIQNIALALLIKAVFLVLTVAGLGTMWMAVFADVGASLLVVGNGLRLLRHRGVPPSAAARAAAAPAAA